MGVGDHPAQKVIDNKVLKGDVWILLRNLLAYLQEQAVGHREHVVFAGDGDFFLLAALARQLKGVTNDALGALLGDGLNRVLTRP